MKKTNAIVSALIAVAFLAAGASAAAQEKSGDASEFVNINTATASELALLPGVGPSKADAIIKYRAQQPFKAVEHIQRVKGIGRKSFVSMKPYLRIDGPTTLKKKVPMSK